MTLRAPALLLLIPTVLLPQPPYGDLRVERVASGYRYADGPVWHAELDGLVFSDPPNRRVHLYSAGKGVALFRDNSEGAAGLAVDDRGRIVAALPARRALARFTHRANEPLEILLDRFEGKKLNAPNDIVLLRNGVALFTDPAFGAQQDARELPTYGLYRWSLKSDPPSAVWRGDTRLNGLALSPNQRILYAADSDTRQIRAWDLDRSGTATNPRVLVDRVSGVPNGLEVEEKTGNLFVAANAIEIFSPQGVKIRTFEMPELPTNCAFGEKDGKTLYVTTRSHVYSIRLP